MSGISTHVLDTATGRPVQGLRLQLDKAAGEDWRTVRSATTNEDGRIDGKMVEDELSEGIWRMVFHTGEWFSAREVTSFYPIVRVVFSVDDIKEHYHVPLLLSPFGYSTYRGS